MTSRDTSKAYTQVRFTLKIYEGEEDYLMDILCVEKYKDALRAIIMLTDTETQQDSAALVQDISAIAKDSLVLHIN